MQEVSAFLNGGRNEEIVGQFVLISDAHTDGSFLTHHFIAQALKDGHLTYLVSFAQSYVHYHSIATKLGVNLSKQQEAGNFVFVDCLSNLLAQTTAPPDKELGSKMTFSLDSSFSLSGLYQLLHSSLTQQQARSRDPSRPVCLVLDDLSVLLSVGVRLQEIVGLVDYCRYMLTSDEGTCECGGYLVAMVHCEDGVSEVVGEECPSEEELLKRHLLHNCQLSLHVSGLSTGYSKDVHGELTAEWRDLDGTQLESMPTKKHTQYKLTDRTVRLFAKGTSNAIL